jgi:hypothetical protein
MIFNELVWDTKEVEVLIAKPSALPVMPSNTSQSDPYRGAWPGFAMDLEGYEGDTFNVIEVTVSYSVGVRALKEAEARGHAVLRATKAVQRKPWARWYR